MALGELLDELSEDQAQTKTVDTITCHACGKEVSLGAAHVCNLGLAASPVLAQAEGNVPAEIVDRRDIQVGERFRKEYKDIDKLAESINLHGLMQYPVLDQDNNLIAGGRRLQALDTLKWINIPIVRKQNISPLRLREMELEENLQRSEMSWSEAIALKAEILRLKQELHGTKGVGRSAAKMGGVSQADVAEMVGDSPATFSQDLALAKAVEEVPELANCATKDEARKKLKQLQEVMLVEELNRRASLASKKKEDAHIESGSPAITSIYSIAERAFIVKDALVGLTELPALIPDLKYINIDTPYGIDLNSIKRDEGTQIIQHNYLEWDKKEFIEKCRVVAAEAYRTAAPNTFMTWWFAIQWYQPLIEMLQEVGWKVDPIPNIWDTGDQGQTNQPEMYLARCYEPFFTCRKGQPIMFQRGRSNIFRYKKLSADKKIHPTEKPVELMEELFKTYAQPGCTFLSPFLGSGNDLRAAFKLGFTGLGFDLNPEVKKRFLIRVVEDEKGVKVL